MKQILGVAILFLGSTVGLTFGRANTGATSQNTNPTSPVIIAHGKLVNQTAPIPTTTIFTPAHDGTYRVSIYATVTTNDPSSASYWSYAIAWDDDAGSESVGGLCFQNGSQRGQFVDEIGYVSGGAVVIIEAKGGTPVTHTMSQIGPPDNSAYSLYYVVERLE